jgi:CIC family chloride channel protein
LTVGKMMRHDVRTIPIATTVATFREAFPLGSSAQIIAIDNEGRYVGMAAVAEAHAVEVSLETPIKELLRHPDDFLLPGMAIKEAVLAFDRAESEALAVVDTYRDRRVIGLLTEAFALRRYSAELERRRQELVGED